MNILLLLGGFSYGARYLWEVTYLLTENVYSKIPMVYVSLFAHKISPPNVENRTKITDFGGNYGIFVQPATERGNWKLTNLSSILIPTQLNLRKS